VPLLTTATMSQRGLNINHSPKFVFVLIYTIGTHRNGTIDESTINYVFQFFDDFKLNATHDRESFTKSTPQSLFGTMDILHARGNSELERPCEAR
jgi:hypothetical protein